MLKLVALAHVHLLADLLRRKMLPEKIVDLFGGLLLDNTWGSGANPFHNTPALLADEDADGVADQVESILHPIHRMILNSLKRVFREAEPERAPCKGRTGFCEV